VRPCCSKCDKLRVSDKSRSGPRIPMPKPPDNPYPVEPATRVLRESDLSAGWDAGRFLGQGAIRLFQAGDIVTRRGESPGYVGLIVDGAVEVSQTARSGRRHVLDFVGRGELLNLISALDGSSTIHDMRAHQDTHVLMIGSDLLRRTMQAEPACNQAVIGLLCKRSRNIYGNLAGMPFATVRERCLRTLLRLAQTFGKPCDEGTAISLKLSQEVIAEMIGRARPNVNRELKQLEREGLVRLYYQQFIVDIDSLRLALKKG